MKELKEMLKNALDYAVEVNCKDEFYKHSIYDELHNTILQAVNMIDKIDKLDDTTQTKEIVYLTSEYRYTDVEKRMFLLCRYAHSLHELKEMHTYEVTMQRSKADNEVPTVDYVHKAIVIADFDMSHCAFEYYKTDFRDEIFDALFDCRFNTLDATIKQLS